MKISPKDRVFYSFFRLNSMPEVLFWIYIFITILGGVL
jgi:hypothetical protein